MKAAAWNPEFSSKYKTNGAIGRPRRRCEDVKLEETETEMSTENDKKNNSLWIYAAQERRRWIIPSGI